MISTRLPTEKSEAPKITYPTTGTFTHVVEKNWDPRFGKLLWEQDENGQRVYYSYDGFGRIVQMDYPDGGQMVTEYRDQTCTAGACVPMVPHVVVTSVKETPASLTDSRLEYFDGLNRSVQTVTYGTGVNEQLITQTKYDIMGRPEKAIGPINVTSPYSEYLYDLTAHAPYPYTQSWFDARGRTYAVASNTSVNNYEELRFTYFGYFGLDTGILDPDFNIRMESRDYLGRLTAVTEYPDGGPAPVTTYQYNAAGDLTKITDAIGKESVIAYDSLGRKTSMTDPDMGAWTYTYDAAGNLRTQVDGKQQKTTFTYDALNRLTGKVYSNGDPTVTYVYDWAVNGKGRLYRVTNANATTRYDRYDVMGRPKQQTRVLTGGGSHVTKFDYDLLGRPTRVWYPSGAAVLYADYSYYPHSNLLEAVTGSDGTVFARYDDYFLASKASTVTFGNGVVSNYSYNPLSAILEHMETRDRDNNILIDRSYQYTSAGDVASIIDNEYNTVYSYAYDGLHRLVSETISGAPYAAVTYAYDGIGRITRKTVGEDFYLYKYSSTVQRPHHSFNAIVVNGLLTNFSYDENGNMVSGIDLSNPAIGLPGRTISYNADNMPTAITHGWYGSTTIAYDGGGRRVKKSTAIGDTFYVNQYMEIEQGQKVTYVFAGSQRIAVSKGGAWTYFHQDHLGSSSVLTAANGLLKESILYRPYGETRRHYGPPITGPPSTNYKFTGQEHDPETGLYNYNARLYDPVTGMFISADSIVPNFSDPQSLNRFMYVRGNPLRYTDPSGNIAIIDDILFGAVLGSIIGGTIEAISGGDFVDGMLSGAISGSFFGVAGGIINTSAQAGAALTQIAQVGIHTAAGVVSGGINSAISGSDLGLGMLVGGLSGGLGKYASPSLRSSGYFGELAGRSLIGGAVGGISAELYGGDFGYGFRNGAMTGAVGFVANDFLHEQILPYLRQVVQKTFLGGSLGVRAHYGLFGAQLQKGAVFYNGEFIDSYKVCVSFGPGLYLGGGGQISGGYAGSSQAFEGVSYALSVDYSLGGFAPSPSFGGSVEYSPGNASIGIPAPHGGAGLGAVASCDVCYSF